MRRPLLVELLLLVGPILVMLIFVIAFKKESAWIASLNVLLGAFLTYHEERVKIEVQEDIDESLRELQGDKPNVGRKTAAHFFVMYSDRYKRYGAHKVTSIVGVFVGTIQVLTYW